MCALYLLENSDLYKNENIEHNTDWLSSISDDSSSLVKEVESLIQYQTIFVMMTMKQMLSQRQTFQKLQLVQMTLLSQNLILEK